MTDNHRSDRTDLVDELVKAARTDRTALGQLFDQFYPSISVYCMRRLLSRAVAEDVTSEIFLKVAVHIGDFTGSSTEDFRRWLFRIATNEINAQLRQSIRRRELLYSAAQMGAVNSAVSTPLLESKTQFDWDEVYQAISELTQREQSIVSLRFFAELKHDQIAAVLDMKTGSVRVALSRALDKLRERLQKSNAPQRLAPGPTGGDD